VLGLRILKRGYVANIRRSSIHCHGRLASGGVDVMEKLRARFGSVIGAALGDESIPDQSAVSRWCVCLSQGALLRLCIFPIRRKPLHELLSCLCASHDASHRRSLGKFHARHRELKVYAPMKQK